MLLHSPRLLQAEGCTHKHRARRCSAVALHAAVEPSPAPVELLVLDFDHGLVAPGGGLQTRGLPSALAHTALPFYVICDDAASATATLAADAGVDVQPGRLFPRTCYGLSKVVERPLVASTHSRVHLVSSDTRLLCIAAEESALSGWELRYLSVSGQKGSELPSRVTSFPLESLVELLNFGLLMGVNDGCQDEE